ncbi:Cytosol aminopeptidase [Buchnera aphidicola (Periphyllus testudinaceus)]|uniref:leucyl aminopeptidase n=1 Tax=Buchnera aphidicola TaxID=9 RepID=UPI0034649531
MKITPYIHSSKIYKNNCLVFGIYSDKNLENLLHFLNVDEIKNIKKLLQKSNLKEKFGKILLFHNSLKSSYDSILLINCGKKKYFSNNLFSKIIEKIFLFLKQSYFKNIYINFVDFNKSLNTTYWRGRNFVNIIKNIFYSFNKYKSSKNKKLYKIKKIFVKVDNKKNLNFLEKSIKHSLAISQGINLAKDISNTPPNICNPKYLSYCSVKLQNRYKNTIKIKILNENDIKKLGMNAFLSVSKGSFYKAYMSIIYYNKNKNTINKKPFVLVGKGVTFDSGGISIKSSYLMDEMKYDMCGSASVLGTIDCIAKLNLPIKVIGIISACENMPGNKAFRPGDIIKTMSGKTVEILNTDAEGRLILCDILTYVERFNPKLVIDIATLTGSCVSILGNAASGLFTNNKTLSKDLNKASKKVDDKVWNLPNFKIYKKYLKSNFADLSNIGGKNSGASVASYFLSYFAKKYKWAHLDIAGTAWNTGDKKGATGKPVTLLCQYFLNFLKKND